MTCISKNIINLKIFVNVLHRARWKILTIWKYLPTSYNVHVDKYHICSDLFILVLVFTRQSSSAPRWELRLTDLSATCHSQTWFAGATSSKQCQIWLLSGISKRYQQTCRNRVVPWSVLASWCQGLCLTTSVEGEKLPKTQFQNETWCVTWMSIVDVTQIVGNGSSHCHWTRVTSWLILGAHFEKSTQ